jgi:hypothetical protein
MATIVQNRNLPGEIRVAAVFDTGAVIRPVGFEQLAGTFSQAPCSKVPIYPKSAPASIGL